MTTSTDTAGVPPLLLDGEATRQVLGGISRNHLDNLVKRGDIPAVRIGRRVMFRATDVQHYVANLATR